MLDAALINAAQAAEHYEIARYGSLIAWAQATRPQRLRQRVAKTLEEEKAPTRN